jgi:iron(III) transport system substrate-binding protein
MLDQPSQDIPSSPRRGGSRRERRTRLPRVKPAVLLSAALAVLLLFVSACTSGNNSAGGSDAKSTYEKFAAMSGEERQTALVEQAKKEGTVVLYTTNSDTVAKIAPAFKAKYGITVEGQSQNSEPLRQKLEQENQAKRVGADIVETLALDLRIYANKGILTDYKNDEVTSQLVPFATQFPGFVISSYYPYMVAWNTNLVKGSDVPKSYQDLADPKWAGKLAMVEGDGTWYATLYYYMKDQGMSDEEFTTMMKAIAKNSQVASGHGSTTNLLGSGDFSVDMQVFQFDLLSGQKDGQPIAAEPYVKPVINLPIGAGLSATAPHPAAALLWMDFYLTEGAKIFVEQVSRQTTNKTVAASANFIPPADAQVNVALDKLDTDAKVAAWETAYANLIKGNDGVLPKDL